LAFLWSGLLWANILGGIFLPNVIEAFSYYVMNEVTLELVKLLKQTGIFIMMQAVN